MTHSPVTFTAGCAINRDMFYLACSVDAFRSDDVPSTVMCFYQHQTADKWYYHELPGWRVVSAAYLPPSAGEVRKVFSLSEQGDVECYSRIGATTEHIPGAGLDDGRGYMARLKFLGARLHACGSAGQVYRKDDDGWTDLSPDLGQGELSSEALPLDDPDALLAVLSESMSEQIDMLDISSVGDGLLVVGSNGFIAHRSKGWRTLDRGTAADLNALCVRSASDIWIVGSRGTILRGNPNDGFTVLSRKALTTDFYSITEFQGHLYVGAGDGLYVLSSAGESIRVEALETLDLAQVHTVESVDGVLWVASEKRLLRFDGATWESFEHPNNT